jgi:DNA damage-binding protein 1
VVLREPGAYGSLAAVGNLSHGAFRSFENQAKRGEWRGFVDGDLVESFLSLPPSAASAVVQLLLDDGFVGPHFLPAASTDGSGGGSRGGGGRHSSSGGSGRPPASEVQAELVRRIEEMARRH